MASLTVRQLDEKVKKLLRLRAARHGRSMEDEIRTILRPGSAGQAARDKPRSAARDAPEAAALAPPAGERPAQPTTAPRAGRGRVLLIIGGGIAAYKSLDLIRRLQDHGVTVRCILTKAAQEFVTPLAAGALAGGAGLHRPVRSEIRIRRRAYPARARHRSRRGRARHRRPDGEDGGRPRRRSRQRGAARHRQADPDRAGDEPDDVVAQGDAAQPRATDRRRRRDRRARTRARWRSAAKPAPAAWPSRSRSPRRR